jgi:uncharacterized RDD family membrane protein YckC
MSLQIETAQNVGVDYEMASIGDRILAQLIDYAVYVIWFVACLAAMAIGSSNSNTKVSEWAMVVIVILPVMSYSLLCEYFLNGQTAGKMALKIRVIKIDGTKPTLSAYLLRWLLSVVDISLFSGMVAVLTIAITGKGQRVGDIAAGTTVIKTHPSIRLDQILYSGLTPNYAPSYPGAVRLSEKDINTLRKVIASKNPELQQTASHKIEDLLGITSLDEPATFLSTIISDYQYYMTSADDSTSFR